MNENKLKISFLHVTIAIALIAFSYAVVSFVQSYEKTIQPSSFRSFTVSAEGAVTKVPDIAEFSFSVISEGGTDIASLQKNTVEKNNAIIAFLKTKNVDEKDITTTSYDIYPRYQQCYSYQMPNGICPPAKIVGYTVTQTTNVKVRDFNVIGDVLGGVADKGANSVGQLQFRIDDETMAQTEARNEAIEKAKEKADQIAKTTGFSVGRLLRIDEESSYPVYYESKMMDYASMETAGASLAPTVSAGSQEVKVTMTLTYEIE